MVIKSIKRTINLLFVLLSSLYFLDAQTVTGVVNDETGMALIGASISVKESNQGTITDVDGKFTLEVGDLNNTTLVVSYIGYETLEVPLVGRSNVEISLNSSTSLIDEIVVVGYGTQRKSDLTGAISTVKADEIKRQANGNVTQTLQGKIAGMQVTPISGTPGEGAVIRIRGIGTFGNSDPLFVVDGMLLNDINFLNPNDIESVEVLKDASATAIFGSRGANGVIIITTKKGSRTGEGVITAEAYYGWQEVVDKISLVNGAQYAQLVNELSVNEGGNIRYPDPESFGAGTDWQDVIYETAPIMNYQLGANGGNENLIYNMSFNYFKQDGVMRGYSFERFSIRLNNEYRIKENISLGHNLAFIHNKRDVGPGLVNTALRSAPIASPFDSLGNFSPETAETSSTGNAEASLFYNNNKNFSYRGVGNIYADIKFLRHFTFKSSFGIDLSQLQGKSFTPVFMVSAIQQNQNSRISVREERNLNLLWENTLTYNQEWTNHRINVLAGMTTQEFEFEQLRGERLNLIGEAPSFFYLEAGDETTSTANNSADTWSMLSYLFRTNYTAFDKYLLTASFRVDGSSRFGSNKRFSYFPSLALGWNVTNEGFMLDQDVVSRLKIRGSYGRVGNDKIGTFRYSPLVTSNLNVIFGPTESIEFVQNGAAVLNLANPDLQWEETNQANLGFEIGLLDNRLTAEIDYYVRTTDKILASVPIPSYIGSEADPIVNAAKMRNQGVDLNLSWRETKGDFSYSVKLVGSTVNNEVLELGGGKEEIFGGGLNFGGWLGTRTVVGEPIGSFYGWKVAGVFQNEEELNSLPSRGSEDGVGDLRFEDLNGVDADGNLTGQPDGKIDDNDRTIIGNPIPDLIYGFSLNVGYKGFDLAIDFNGQYGNEIFNAKKASRFGLYNFETSFLDRWTEEGSSDFEPRVTNSGHNYIPSDRFIEDGSFLRLRNVTFGYTFPDVLKEKINIRDLRLYVSGNNLYTWKTYSGYTPEIVNISNGTGDPFANGIDRGIFPIAKSVTVGLSLSF